MRTIDNSGNNITICPEFSKGQFGKTNDAINRIVHNKNKIIFGIAIISFLIVLAPIISSAFDNSIGNKFGDEKRVFIKIKEPISGKKLSTKAVTSPQSNIESKIGPGKINHNLGNYLSASVNNEDLKLLENDPDIEVHLIPILKVLLQDSSVIINATQIYSLQESSRNLTGAEQTVCVIDTGINYTHPSLGGCYGNNNVSSSCKVIGGWDYCSDNAECTTEDSNPMDANGHGTHVAGIISANGSIRGIAPDSRLVVIKVCNSTGECFADNLIAGIDWCVNNRSRFNISIISISIGGGNYTNYCDSDEPWYVGSINKAVSNGISVVIAAGNSGLTNQISAPSCIFNATAVGATDKSDAIASYSNRAQIMSLFAPGTNIISTCITGDSCSHDGTSMSAPHVSGAIALMKQYLNLSKQFKTPKQIESILNLTGKEIKDSTGYNYSKINIFSALISLDNSTPNVGLVSPSNSSFISNQNVTFICNATDLSLKNVSFYLWDTNGMVNNSTQNISGSSISSVFIVANLSLSNNYHWNCYYYDSNNLLGYSPANYTLNSLAINVSLLSPANNLYTNDNQSYMCNAHSISALRNSSFYIWNSTSSIISTLNSSSETELSYNNFSFNFSYEGVHYWNCMYINVNNISSFASSNFTINYDLTTPLSSVISPLNGTWQNYGKFNVAIDEIGSCAYSLDNGINNFTMGTIDNLSFNSSNTTLVDNQHYDVLYYCKDRAGNLNISPHFRFFIDISSPNVSSLLPLDGKSITSSSIEEVFQYTILDNLNISNCSLILNNNIALTDSGVINQSSSYNFTKSLSSGSYTWNIRCVDLAGNAGNSASRALIINSPAQENQNTGSSGESSGSGGSGGGGAGASVRVVSSAKNYYPKQEQLAEGYFQEVGKQDKIRFTLPEEKEIEHTITLEEIREDLVNLTLRSEPQNLLLKVGQDIKLNISSSDYYNLYIKLEEIKQERALLNIRIINESIVLSKNGEYQKESKERTSITGKVIETKPALDRSMRYNYLAIFILALIGLAIRRISLRKSKAESKNILKNN